MTFEGLHTDAFLAMKTLSKTLRPLYHWKAEDLSFLYVWRKLIIHRTV